MMHSSSAGIITGMIAACLAIALIAAYVTVPQTPVFTDSFFKESPITGHAPSSSHGLTFSSGASRNGLELVVDLNSTNIQQREGLAAQIELRNTRGENLSTPVPPFDNTATYYAWNQQDNICGSNPSNFLVDFAVFKGHFSAQNISEAGSQLRLVPAWSGPCPPFGYYYAVTFLPNGDLTNYTQVNYSLPQPRSSYLVKAEVNVTTYYCSGSGVAGNGGEIDCGNTHGLIGYWNGTVQGGKGDWYDFASPAFTYFQPGEYTIVATDPWNQYVYVNFIVEAGH